MNQEQSNPDSKIRSLLKALKESDEPEKRSEISRYVLEADKQWAEKLGLTPEELVAQQNALGSFGRRRSWDTKLIELFDRIVLSKLFRLKHKIKH